MSQSSPVEKPKIVIIGGGFAGLNLVKSLRYDDVDMLLLDANPHHTFVPLIYQVAAGELEANNVIYPLDDLVDEQHNIRFQQTRVEAVDLAQQQVVTDTGTYPYDFLVIATGSRVNFYGLEAQADAMLRLRDVQDALQMRAAVMARLEQANAIADREEQQRLLQMAIVGGGPTGLELAGALTEMREFVLPERFPNIVQDDLQIHLYERGARLLAAMSEKASADGLRYMEEMGVTVHLGIGAETYQDQLLKLTNGEQRPFPTVIWAAGVQGSGIAGIPADLITKENRIRVDDHYRLTAHPEVFAIGDTAVHATAADPHGLPMLAPVAMQQGQYVARVIRNGIRGREISPFSYLNKGNMAIIGRGKAVADIPFTYVSGFPAWSAWLAVHLYFLKGLRSKMGTLLSWINNYIQPDLPLNIIAKMAKAATAVKYNGNA